MAFRMQGKEIAQLMTVKITLPFTEVTPLSSPFEAASHSIPLRQIASIFKGLGLSTNKRGIVPVRHLRGKCGVSSLNCHE